MIVGGGQIAKAFYAYSDDPDVIVFASGVSNSNEQDENKFKQEEELINYHLRDSFDKKFLYFSSCALNNGKKNNSPYYKHKLAMEKHIQANSSNSYIFRLPQLFGTLKRHSTLINYLYYKIIDDEEFDIYDQAFRYVIHLDDVVSIVTQYIQTEKGNITLDIANPYAYSINEIIECLEIMANKKAIYSVTKKSDRFNLDLSALLAFTKQKNIQLEFGKDYLYKKLGVKLP